METINQTVARSVLQLRKKAGLSQLMLATEARIALKTLHTAERAASNLRLSTLEKMVGAFGIKRVFTPTLIRQELLYQSTNSAAYPFTSPKKPCPN